MAGKQKLLDSEKFKRDLERKKKANTITKQQAAINAKMAQLQGANQQAESKEQIAAEPKSKKGLIYTLAALALVLILLPKPQLIKYEKLQIVTESIMFPSFLGINEPFLLDSRGELKMESDEWIYICNTINSKKNCQRYRLIEQKGIFGVLGYILR